ncbi:MAG: QueT transporter family protein [Lachnospiraceae bacterium]|nr:QueT transporter family protein [Lachnospiraceae bacterium]
MDIKNMNQTQKLTFSGAVMAVYIVVMYFTQSFAFGQYQVRIATAVYSTAYLFPFLVVPLGLSNLLSNMLMGGFGIFDIVGGGLVGLLTAGSCALLGRFRCKSWLVALPIALIPSFGVSTYLSGLLVIYYWSLALRQLVGQIISGVAGAALIKALCHIWQPSKPSV